MLFQVVQLFHTQNLCVFDSLLFPVAVKKDEQINKISELRKSSETAPAFGSGVAPGQSREELKKLADELEKQLDEIKVPAEEEQEKKQLLAEGFPDWNR